MIAGVDGCRGGWVVAMDAGDGLTRVELHPSFGALLAAGQLRLIAIDVPIGLLARGPRACDLLARRLLGRPRGSSVFPAPLRPMLRARSWEEASAIRLRVEGKRCSRQTFGILPKIREVDARMRPGLQRRVVEVHPEVSLALMNGGQALGSRKSTPRGRAERLALLEPHFPDLRANLERLPGVRTDLIDAYACLWTARRIRLGRALRLPPVAERDPRGLRAEIVA